MTDSQKIFLAGFMGTGKSSVGRLLAARLGYSYFDTDAWIEAQQQKTVAQIFAESGESQFRRLESEAIARLALEPHSVISLGGGAVCRQENLDFLQKSGRLLLLRASPQKILERIQKESTRPLLQVENPLKKIRELLKDRERFYGQIAEQIHTDSKSPEELVELIMEMLELEKTALKVPLRENAYPLYFSNKLFDSLPVLLQKQGLGSRFLLVTNTTVDKLYGKEFEKKFRAVEFQKLVLPDGEKYKTLKTVEKVYEALLRFRADRKTAVIALGGGVIGDLVGFAAATYLRGIPFVQIPTTLLAQVDSSIGGKTGVDLPQGKNLVGAFYQPKLVWISSQFLKTLPQRQLSCGLAEVVKYAAIFDAKLFDQLEVNSDKILKNPVANLTSIIRRCCEWKAWVVQKDEKETKGLRAKLNFGHTLGHAIEAVTHYQKYTHGEAISMGMAFAAEKSRLKTKFSLHEAERLKSLLQRFGLPVEFPKLSIAALKKALVQDKKRVSNEVHFIYLKKIGKSEVISTPLEELL